MKKLASFAAMVLIAPSVPTAQLGLAHGALGAARQAGGMQIAGRIILIPDPRPEIQLVGGAVLQSASGGFVAYEDDSTPASKVAHVGAFAPYEGGASLAEDTLANVGGFVAHGSTSAATVREISGKRLVNRGFTPRGSMAELGGFVAYEDDNTPASKVAELGGFVAYEDDSSPASTVANIGGFVAHGSTSASTVREISGKRLVNRGFTPRGSMAELGGFVAYEDDNTPASKVAQAGGMVAYEDDSSPASTVASAGGFVAHGSSAASASLAVRDIDAVKLPKDRKFISRGTMTGIGSFIPYKDPRTDPLDTVVNIGGATAHGSSPASASLSLRDIDAVKLPKDRKFISRGTMTGIGGFVAYEDDNTPASKVAQAGGMVAYEDDGGGAKSLGRTREIGGAIARSKPDDPHARGTFGHVSVGPQAYGEEGELEPNPVEVTQVTLFGRSGSSYALVIQQMGSANSPQVLIAHGMLFGTDPEEGVRKLVMRVPVEFGLFLIPLE